MGTKGSSDGLGGALRRAKFRIAVLALTGLVGAIGFALVKPKSYHAATRLAAESATGDAAGGKKKVEALESEILDYETMLLARRALDLDENPDELQANTSVRFKPLTAGRFEITIAHAGSDPLTSKTLVEHLSRGYQANVYERPVREQAKSTEQLAKKAAASAQVLADLESRVTTFSTEKADYLEIGSQRLAEVRDSIQKLKTEGVDSLDKQLGEHRRSIAVEKPNKEREYFGFDKEKVASLERRIKSSRGDIRTLMDANGWPEDHPDLLSRQEQIRTLERTLEAAKADKQRRTERVPNPMYDSLRDAIAQLESRLEVARRKLGAQRKEEQRLLRNAQLAPEIKKEYEALVVERDAARGVSEEDASTANAAAQKLAEIREQRALKFETLEEAKLPTGPTGTGTPLIALMGLIAGALAGMALTVALSGTDKSFRRVEAVSAHLGVPTLGVIDAIKTPEDLASERAVGRKQIMILVVMALVACAGLVLSFTGGDAIVMDLVKGLIG